MGNTCQCFGNNKEIDEKTEMRPDKINERNNNTSNNYSSADNTNEKYKSKNPFDNFEKREKEFNSNNNNENYEPRLDNLIKKINKIQEENNDYIKEDEDDDINKIDKIEVNEDLIYKNEEKNPFRTTSQNTEFIVATNIINNNNFQGEIDIEDSIDKNLIPEDDFSKYIFNQINLIRQNPKSFIPLIEKSKSNIQINKLGILIYKSKVKVALSKGKEAFDEAINDLNNIEPMNKLIYFPKLNIPLPDNEDKMKSKEYLKNIINDLTVPVKSYWKDNIKDPETSFILMIVDTKDKINSNKRKSILDRSLKFMGICSQTIGKTFCCYLTFSNKLI